MQSQEVQQNNTAILVGGVIAVVVIIVIIAFAMSSSSSPEPVIEPEVQPIYIEEPAAAPPPEYSFHPYMDSAGNDIRQIRDLVNKVDELKAECDALADCVGFNTNAWLKRSIRPESQWVRWTGDPSKGLYIKPGIQY